MLLSSSVNTATDFMTPQLCVFLSKRPFLHLICSLLGMNVSRVSVMISLKNIAPTNIGSGEGLLGINPVKMLVLSLT